MKLRLSEEERDRLRMANENLMAAQTMLSRAETVWQFLLGEILGAHEISMDLVKTMKLQDDMKYLTTTEKEEPAHGGA